MRRKSCLASGRVPSECDDPQGRSNPASAIDRSRRTLLPFAFGLSLALTSDAWAGMPFFSLTELAHLRLEVICFSSSSSCWLRAASSGCGGRCARTSRTCRPWAFAAP